MNKMLVSLKRTCWHPLLQRAAQAYVAGPDLADALAVCRAVCQRGGVCTLGYWNRSDDSVGTIMDTYRGALHAVTTECLPCSLSVKGPAFGFSSDLLREILDQTRQSGITVVFDSLWPEAAEATFSLLAQIQPFYPTLGCTLPGRWRRSLRDADRASALGLHVRVVKGQWADPDEPDRDPRKGFLAVIDRLVGGASHVAVATHDQHLARVALRRLRAAGTACELEMLFGLPARRVLQIADEEGVPVRLYVPYGASFLPYRLSRARNIPRVGWWFLRDLLFGRACSWARAKRSIGRVAPSTDPRPKLGAVMLSGSRGN